MTKGSQHFKWWYRENYSTLVPRSIFRYWLLPHGLVKRDGFSRNSEHKLHLPSQAVFTGTNACLQTGGAKVNLR